MTWVWATIGVLLLVVGLLDLFFAVLHYEGYGFLSSRLNRGIWRATRWAANLLPQNLRAFGLALGAPLMVPATLSLWVGLEILGFALLYYVGMNRENFAFQPGLEPGFREALYLSGVSLATLGYGDLTPSSTLYQMLGFAEALIGFGILTLSLSYVLNIYRVLQQFSILAAGLYHQAADPGNPRTILVPYFAQGMPHDFGTSLMNLHQNLVAYHEGMRRYPIVYYFHSRRAYRSTPYVFRMVGEMAAALRWGLPKDCPVTQDPWLSPLIKGFSAVTTSVKEQFTSQDQETPPQPVSFDTFAASVQRDGDVSDTWVERFLELDRWMCQLARLPDCADLVEAYARYKEWLPFAHQTSAFVQATAADLGYNPAEFTHSPGERRF